MSENKTKKCQNCTSEFTIDPSDFDFYKKIEVPEPTFCPDCRAQRRMTWRNERKLYKRKCDFSGKETFSWLAPTAPVKVYDSEIWWSDKWDAADFGRDYDFNRPFWEQFFDLLKEVPWVSRSAFNLVNSDYSMNASDLKNCYFIFNAGKSEDSNYGVNVDMCKDCFDNYFLTKCELCFESLMLTNCYKAFFCSHCDDCQEMLFCKNCSNCSNCFGCVNLRHKKYHIFNQPHSKEEYEKKMKEFCVGSFASKEEVLKTAREFWAKHPVRFTYGRKNENISGEYIFNSKNVKDSFMVDNGENLRYCMHTRFLPSAKDTYDYIGIGRNSELCYEDIIAGRNASRIKFCVNCFENVQNFEYCIQCISSSDLFGCISLRKKQYCILNKQYTKEEYEKMIPRIKAHMDEMPFTDKNGNVYKYGEFFPPQFSPFGYNQTIAQEYFPLPQKEAEKLGYFWNEKPENNYQPTIKAAELPDNIENVDDSMLKEIVECSNNPENKCQGSGVFRMIDAELEFYKKHGLPLPRLCPDCRHHERIKQRNQIKLHERRCMCGGKKDVSGVYENKHDHGHENGQCPNEFETTYAPDQKEIVYCKKCYQRETE